MKFINIFFLFFCLFVVVNDDGHVIKIFFLKKLHARLWTSDIIFVKGPIQQR